MYTNNNRDIGRNSSFVKISKIEGPETKRLATQNCANYYC